MASTILEENRIIAELEQALREIAETFSKTYDAKKKRWPYEIRPGAHVPAGADSETTTAMIACSVLAMRDFWSRAGISRSSSGIAYWLDFPLPELCAAIAHPLSTSQLRRATDSLLTTWHKNKRGKITSSQTFGLDDPMSLSWALDLLQFSQGSSVKSTATDFVRDRIIKRCAERAQALVDLAQSKAGATTHRNQSLCERLLDVNAERQAGDSSYFLVRFAGILRYLKEYAPPTRAVSRQALIKDIDSAQEVLFERFETHLHEQLSFAGIVDSRFDPTELAYCLEGMLLLRPGAVGKTLFDRVMGVLRSVQEATGFWRSETPLIYQERGEVLFTVSVESANAILASFSLYDGRRAGHGSVASDHIDLLKRYWKWLKARKSSVRIGSQEYFGWHSEHVNEPSLIHLWETSQVAEFLVNFRDQLKRHIARTSLRLSACSIVPPKRPEVIAEGVGRKDIAGRWEAAKAIFEPVNALGADFKAYDQIGRSFIVPWLSGAPTDDAAYSLLLYGPPGTGKTTVAQCLCWALDWPQITITVSDFLADGATALEARAKDLFTMLQAQPRSLVLFDEIDQFMLDRDSEFFRDQDTAFQFLTPGMLTKLNDLRASKSVVFIMATNYAERIDRAIKRQGRIDQQIILLPPDTRRRRKFIDGLWPKPTFDPGEASQKSVFQSITDLRSVRRNAPAGSVLDAIAKTEAAAVPAMYVTRFKNKSGDDLTDLTRTPAEELFSMLLLDAEALGFKPRTRAHNAHLYEQLQRLFERPMAQKLGHALTSFLEKHRLASTPPP